MRQEEELAMEQLLRWARPLSVKNAAFAMAAAGCVYALGPRHPIAHRSPAITHSAGALRQRSESGRAVQWILPSRQWLLHQNPAPFAALWRSLRWKRYPRFNFSPGATLVFPGSVIETILRQAMDSHPQFEHSARRENPRFSPPRRRPPRRGPPRDIEADERQASVGPSRRIRFQDSAPPDIEDAPRFLQAQMTRDAPGSPAPVCNRKLTRNLEYLVRVRIGCRDSEWLQGGQPIKIPVPDDEEPQRLEVWFWNRASAKRRQTQDLYVPARGNSQPCVFRIRTPAKAGIQRFRIVVVKEGRILQAGTLSVQIGTGAAQDSPRFQLDVTAQMDLRVFAQQLAYENTLFVDRDIATGDLRVAGNGSPVLVRLSDRKQDELTGAIRKIIGRIGYTPEDFKSIEAAGATKLLRELAQHGAKLYEEITRQAPDLFGKTEGRRLSIASGEGAYLPAEFMYRGTTPENDAPLCPEYRATLNAGECCGRCQEKPGHVVCPLGFLGLSCVIERQAAEEEGRPDPSQEEFHLRCLADDPTASIPAFPGIIFGASLRANNYAPPKTNKKNRKPVTEQVAALVAGLVGESKPLVTDWTGWAESIRTNAPNFLLLLPHHESADSFEYLQIGRERTDDEPRETHPGYLKSLLMKPSHVKREDADPPPVVMLIGCETQLAQIGFESFVTGFRNNGARVVIATVATILGRHAGPVACTLLEEMKKARTRQHTLGQAVLAAKRRLVAEGVMVATALTVFGSTDCRLVPP